MLHQVIYFGEDDYLKLIASALCKIGGRDYNQDFVDVYVDEKSACLVACDGLGSYIGSEVASRVAAKSITGAFAELASTPKLDIIVKPDAVIKNVKLAQATILSQKEKQPLIKSSCTTVAAVFTNFKQTTVAHIGDTRIYFFREDKIAYQSIDHSLAQFAVEKGEIEPREIRSHKDQNKLTRVLGSDYYTPPDVTELGPLQLGDKFVLCTDGFWEYVYEEEMEEIFETALNPENALYQMESILSTRIDKFNDNYSAIIGFVVEE